MKKVIKRFAQKPVKTIKVVKRRQVSILRQSMLKIKAALAQEKTETREMLRIYHQYLQGQTEPGQMKVANQQFLDILKGLGLGVFAVLPFAPLTIPIIVKLGKTVGVDILPSAFVQPVETTTADSPQAESSEK